MQSSVVSSRHEGNIKLIRQVDLPHKTSEYKKHFIKLCTELVLYSTLWKYRVILSCDFDYNVGVQQWCGCRFIRPPESFSRVIAFSFFPLQIVGSCHEVRGDYSEIHFSFYTIRGIVARKP